jgi:hypothetical protein
MPILGILASAITGNLVTGAYESIATETLTGSQSSVTFSSIPATYTHLQLRIMGKTDRALDRDPITVKFNSDSGSNYAEHTLSGNGSSASAGAGSSLTSTTIYRATGNSSATNIFGVIVYDLLDYANTNKYKTGRYLGGYDANGAGDIYFGSTLWQSTSAITSIVLTPSIGSNFLQYSSFALYGIKS